jgi:hypothetical protein
VAPNERCYRVGPPAPPELIAAASAK